MVTVSNFKVVFFVTILVLVSNSVCSFSVGPSRALHHVTGPRFSSSQEPDETAGTSPTTKSTQDDVPAAEFVPQKAQPVEIESTYPIPLPSPILLGSSMILGIASIGSIFELSGGNPTYGAATTAGIAVIGLPTCLFLFYASIKKAMAETEEDDKKFLGKQ